MSAIREANSAVSMMATYMYDALGNRVEKDVEQGGVTTVTRFAYDGNEVWADLSGSNALVTRYVHGDQTDQLFARVSAGGTVAWYLTDRLGSVRNLTDNSGVVQDTIAYDGYGNVTSESNASFGDRYKYTGRELDSESGLQYNRARYYDPHTGRWIGEDPLGFDAGDANFYRYVENDPSNATDPSGNRLIAASDEAADKWVTVLRDRFGIASFKHRLSPYHHNAHSPGWWWIEVPLNESEKVDKIPDDPQYWGQSLRLGLLSTDVKWTLLGYQDLGLIWLFQTGDWLTYTEISNYDAASRAHPAFRLEPGVWGVGHQVRFTPYYHITILIVPTNQARWKDDPHFKHAYNGMTYLTIGANPLYRPEWRGSFPLCGLRPYELEAFYNAPFDDPLRNFGQFLGGIRLPTGLTEDQFIEQLLQRTDTFLRKDPDLTYAASPAQSGDAYNSASFVHGLLIATGAPAPEIMNASVFPGWDKPVPREYFVE